MKISGSKWFSLIKLIAPIVLSNVNPRLAPISDAITDGIEQAESMKGLSGADKLKHVQTIANDAADAINTAHGTVLVNKAGLNEAVQEGVDTVIAMKNVKTPPPVK